MRGLRSKLFTIIDSREPFVWFVQLLACTVLASLIWLCGSFLELFGSGGAIRQEIFLNISLQAPFSAWTFVRMPSLLAHQDLILKISYGLSMLSCCLAFFRPTDWRCVCFLFITFAFIKATMLGAVYGLYEFVHIGLFYAALWSMTNAKTWVKRGIDSARLSRLIGFAFQIHLAVAYLYTGMSKVIGKQWQTGEALWRSMYRSDSTGTRLFDFTFLGNWPWVLMVSGWIVFTFELLYPLSLGRKLRGVIVSALIVMHLMIMLAFGLWLFGGAMIVLNLFYYAQGRRLDQQKDQDGSLLAALGLAAPKSAGELV